MSELLFYSPLLTSEELEFVAAGIADFLGIVFKNTYGGRYEEGIDKATAVSAIIDILIDKSKTMADLAEQIDADYNF